MNRPRDPRRAFTLIELLVVIAIIAILIASVVARWVNSMAPPMFAGDTNTINYEPCFPGGVFPNSIGQRFGPSSFHTGGAHHLLCDGSVRYLSQDLDAGVYDSLITRNGGEVVGEF